MAIRKQIRQCEQCGVRYEPTWNPQRWCSQLCNAAARDTGRLAERKCSRCPTVFRPTKGGRNANARFCSLRCARAPMHGPSAPHTCAWCQGSFVGRKRKYCVECAIEARRQARRAHEHARRRFTGPKDRGITHEKLYQRDKGICWLCGGNVDRSEWSIDHLVPKAHGGTHTWDNVGLAHFKCNAIRRDCIDVTSVVYVGGS